MKQYGQRADRVHWITCDHHQQSHFSFTADNHPVETTWHHYKTVVISSPFLQFPTSSWHGATFIQTHSRFFQLRLVPWVRYLALWLLYKCCTLTVCVCLWFDARLVTCSRFLCGKWQWTKIVKTEIEGKSNCFKSSRNAPKVTKWPHISWCKFGHKGMKLSVTFCFMWRGTTTSALSVFDCYRRKCWLIALPYSLSWPDLC